MAPALAKRYRVVGFTRRGHRVHPHPPPATDSFATPKTPCASWMLSAWSDQSSWATRALAKRCTCWAPATPPESSGSCTSTRRLIAETARTARPTTRFGAGCLALPVPDRTTWRPSRRCDRSSRTSRGSLSRSVPARALGREPRWNRRAHVGAGPPDHSGDVQRAAGRVQPVQA
jgi:hypothetical protein